MRVVAALRIGGRVGVTVDSDSIVTRGGLDLLGSEARTITVERNTGRGGDAYSSIAMELRWMSSRAFVVVEERTDDSKYRELPRSR